jgi:UDP-N-acetylglucosamine--N-acetylmuramyl-(pentapeptide) pyrophosphoryl-undecaprenol N-acetylglucosamine transferase
MAPAIAVAERLTNHRCTFIISHRKVDEVFAQKYSQFTFVKVSAIPLKLSPFAFSKFLISQWASLRFALRFLKERKIDLVLSFGSFTSVAFILAAKIRKIPSILHESNFIPGKAIRFSARFANKILLPQDVSFKHQKKNVEHVGFPIRREFVEISKSDARAQLGWPPSKKIILLVGGSCGAVVLNKWIQQNYMRFAYHNVAIYCIAGPEFVNEREVTFEDCTLHMLPFCKDMNLALRACDFVISRAGAGTIAECQFCKKPMILVPQPHAADHHQLANARKAEQQGVAVVVEQNNLHLLADYVMTMISNPLILATMQHNLEKIFVPNVAEQIANIVENFIQNQRK